LAITDPQPALAAPRAARRRAGLVLDVAVLAGILAVLAFPALSRVAADRQPVAPGSAVVLPPPTPAGNAPLRVLPTGLAPGPPPRRLADLRPAANALLGEARGARFMAQVSAQTLDAGRFRYPEFERIVPAGVAPAAATDLGARLIALGRGRSAAIAAYVLFDRAKARGGCAPHLNQLLLLSADVAPDWDAIGAAGARAAATCPGDPTAGWVVGLFESQADPHAGLARMRALRREFPGSGAVWSQEADALLRVAYVTPPTQPFVARHVYERALAGYLRARRLGAPRAELDLGIARALAGLGRAGDAVAVQRRAIAAAPPSAPLQARLTEYLESARRFADAADAATTLSRLQAAVPKGPGWFPQRYGVNDRSDLDTIEAEDANGPVSLGAGRLRGLSVYLGHLATAAATPVVDLSFIPDFRPSPGVTGSQRWCADWSRRRDALLAGGPEVARAGMPEEFVAVRADLADGHDDTRDCEGEPPMLAGIAALELGDARAARASGIKLDELQDERQNLWRWAGDLAHAERVAREWARRGGAPLPMLRLGEIEFLRRHYDAAARSFDTAARRARERGSQPFAPDAEALLKRGAALVAAGRRDEGLRALRAADDVATQHRPFRNVYAPTVALSWSYYALAQLGDAEREAGALRAAADDYAAARRLEPRFKTASAPAGNADFRVAHLWLNSAITEIGLGQPERGLLLARRALKVDPENPLFLMTTAFAAERAGHHATALRLNRGALWADKTAYPAANDLGVLLARQGRDDEAVAVLRRAVGANRDYALGWFNLGVVLGGMGLRHLPASQGSLARAFALDPALRDREREPTIDARTYRTGLDVSRPLPPEWRFAATQRRAPEKTVGLAALLLVGFGLARALTATRSGRELANTWLEPLGKTAGRVRLPAALRHPAFAVAATLAVVLWPLARNPSGGASAALAGALGLLVLVAAALRARALIARRASEGGEQDSWTPGVVFGLGAAAAGLTWAPLPVLRKAGPRVHWAAPVALACIALPLVTMTAWLGIPLTRALAASALIMAASLLTPIKPVDGGAIAAAGGTAAGLTGLALAVLLVLGLV
jgi:tetratricopeptide (TPR) repeat protein